VYFGITHNKIILLAKWGRCWLVIERRMENTGDAELVNGEQKMRETRYAECKRRGVRSV